MGGGKDRAGEQKKLSQKTRVDAEGKGISRSTKR